MFKHLFGNLRFKIEQALIFRRIFRQFKRDLKAGKVKLVLKNTTGGHIQHGIFNQIVLDDCTNMVIEHIDIIYGPATHPGLQILKA